MVQDSWKCNPPPQPYEICIAIIKVHLIVKQVRRHKIHAKSLKACRNVCLFRFKVSIRQLGLGSRTKSFTEQETLLQSCYLLFHFLFFLTPLPSCRSPSVHFTNGYEGTLSWATPASSLEGLWTYRDESVPLRYARPELCCRIFLWERLTIESLGLAVSTSRLVTLQAEHGQLLKWLWQKAIAATHTGLHKKVFWGVVVDCICCFISVRNHRTLELEGTSRAI